MPSAAFAYLVHDFSPFLYRFSENIGIRYYGLAYILGFLAGAGLLVTYVRAGKTVLKMEQIGDLILFLMIGVYAGGRVGHFMLYDGWMRMKEDPWTLFKVWEGGMSFHGGLAGVAIAIYFFSRTSRLGFPHLSDLIASLAPVGLFFGRMANFINGELFGKPSNLPWAFVFPNSEAPGTALVPRHPSQLYEAVLEGLVLFAFVQHRLWRNTVVTRAPGRLAGEFMVGYAVARSVCELFREPDAGISLVFGLSRGTFYSLFLVGAGIFMIWNAERRRPAS